MTRKASPRDFLVFGRPDLGRREVAAAARVLRSGWIGMGPETASFEEELAAYTNAGHVVTVNSCTSALFLSLAVSGVGAGDEVICPSFTWCSTANAVLYLGARPIFCDVSPETFCATAESVRARITRRTKAVIVVHMGGLAADVNAIRDMLPRHVTLIEDAAHALGARYPDGSPVGSRGDLTCFSFYANKNLSTGEGGAIALGHARTAERLRSLRLHGLDSDAWKRYTHPGRQVRLRIKMLGYKMNYTDLQAAIGRVQLRRQAIFARRRRSIARHYCTEITRRGLGLALQEGIAEVHHARHLFQVLLPARRSKVKRDEVVRTLRERQIGASVHYYPLHGFPIYRAGRRGDLSVTEDIGRRVLTLPISASMTLDDAQYVVDRLEQVLQGDRP